MKIGLSNLRRLQDFPLVELRPLTILVGRNSSGKSTFLRSLPLIRQSITTRTSSPILWFGELVDFDNFDGAISHHDSTLNMTFEFKVEGSSQEENFLIYEDFYYEHSPSYALNGSLSIQIGKDGPGTRINNFVLTNNYDNTVYRVSVGKNSQISSLIIDETEMIGVFSSVVLQVLAGSLFPSLVFALREPGISTPFSRAAGFSTSAVIVRNAVAALLRPYLDKRTTVETLQKLVSSLFNIKVISREGLLSSLGGINNISWNRLIKDISAGKKEHLFLQIKRLLHLARFHPLLRGIVQELQATLSSTLYIGPARAKSDRYYRYQDLNVSEIDPNGQNFAMFLNSLQPRQIKAFSDWVQSLFGYGVEIARTSGHISINLQYGSGPVNIVDTGYGVSQILPVLGQIWWANARPSFRRLPNSKSSALQIIAIEQPELHLHPAHQALLADAFTGALKANTQKRLSLVVETHSEVMINRLGALIADEKISERDIQIIVFEDRGDEDDVTTVSVINFNSDGELLNWPYGFFLPEAK